MFDNNLFLHLGEGKKASSGLVFKMFKGRVHLLLWYPQL